MTGAGAARPCPHPHEARRAAPGPGHPVGGAAHGHGPGSPCPGLSRGLVGWPRAPSHPVRGRRRAVVTLSDPIRDTTSHPDPSRPKSYHGLTRVTLSRTWPGRRDPVSDLPAALAGPLPHSPLCLHPRSSDHASRPPRDSSPGAGDPVPASPPAPCSASRPSATPVLHAAAGGRTRHAGRLAQTRRRGPPWASTHGQGGGRPHRRARRPGPGSHGRCRGLPGHTPGGWPCM